MDLGTGLRLGTTQRVQLAGRYPGQCLCLPCLRHLAAAPQVALQPR